jgi:hypothetical protein
LSNFCANPRLVKFLCVSFLHLHCQIFVRFVQGRVYSNFCAVLTARGKLFRGGNNSFPRMEKQLSRLGAAARRPGAGQAPLGSQGPPWPGPPGLARPVPGPGSGGTWAWAWALAGPGPRGSWRRRPGQAFGLGLGLDQEGRRGEQWACGTNEGGCGKWGQLYQ